MSLLYNYITSRIGNFPCDLLQFFDVSFCVLGGGGEGGDSRWVYLKSIGREVIFASI